MKASRITAFGLVAGAALWIASGHFLPHESAESRAAIRTVEGEAKKLFRVAVSETYVVPHSRKLVLSGRTEADKRVVINSRANGEVKEVRVKRGSVVKAATSSRCSRTRRVRPRWRRHSRSLTQRKHRT